MKKSIALIFAASTLFLAGCCTAHHDKTATRWDYQQVHSIEEMQALAPQGWILAGYGSHDDILLKHARQ
jgi:hypothetical protein